MANSVGIEPIIQSRILVLREQWVMLDADLAQRYFVDPRVLVQAVVRNLARFPSDLTLQMSAAEYSHFKSQNVISNTGLAVAEPRPMPSQNKALPCAHQHSPNFLTAE